MQIIIQIAVGRPVVVTNSPSNEAPINSTYLPANYCAGHCGGEESGKIRRGCGVAWRAHAGARRYRVTRLSAEGKKCRLDKKFPAKTRFRPPIYNRGRA